MLLSRSLIGTLVQRLAVDPHSNNVLFFGARSGHGLWKSTNFGATWTQVTSLPDAGTLSFIIASANF
jgi:hypothetical protein